RPVRCNRWFGRKFAASWFGPASLALATRTEKSLCMVLIFFDSLVEIPALFLHTGWQLLIFEVRSTDSGPTGGMSKDIVLHGQAECSARGGLVLHVLS